MYFYVIAFLVCAGDQFTKLLIVNNFSLYQSTVILPGFFNLTYVTNRGAAFSLLAEVESPWRHYFFVTVAVLALIALTVMQIKYYRELIWQSISLALIAGGALGNLIDRIRYGAVVDFLDFYWNSYHWPAFNLADSAICIGVFWYFIINILENNNLRKTEVK